MDKRFIVPKWVLIIWPKIAQVPQNLAAQFVCLSPKVWNIIGKRLHQESVLRGGYYNDKDMNQEPVSAVSSR